MADEEDFSGLPITERATHKIWKVRKQAYEDAAAEFARSPDESAACFTPWMMDPGLWKKVVLDSNVAAQVEGINALCAFIQYGGPSACMRTRGQCIGPLVEKGLSSAKAGTKAKATEAILLYVELDVPGPVIEELVPFLTHKMPKLIAATVTVLTAIYTLFGARTVDPKAVLKQLPKLFGHADKNVRAESSKLALELYKWLKEAMKPMFWGDLKPVQQKELDEAFEKVKDETPKQERLLRSQQAAQAAAEAAGEEIGEEEEEAPQVDAYDLAEPVDVIGALPKDFHDQVSSTKWKERKEALETLFAGLNVPRIKDSDYGEVVRALAKCMKDANVAVVTVAANCIEVLANGLRKSFSKYRSIVMGPIMERLKEKKQGVIDALAKALDAVFNSTSLSESTEDILDNMKHKNPNVKLEVTRFLVRCLSNTRDFPTKAEQKAIAEGASKLLSDSSAPLREVAAEAMGTLMKIIGERAMNPYMDGLDEIRKTKIKEFFDSAKVKAKDKPKPIAPPPVAAPTKAPPKKVFGAKANMKPGLKKPPPKVAAPSGPAEEEPPPPPKPAARAPPSKLGGLKAPGGLRLQKKPLAPGAANASPKRPVKVPSPEPMDEDPPAAAPARKIGFGSGTRLAGRPLQKETPAPPTVSPGLLAAEKAELEELRAEKEQWAKDMHEFRLEKSKMMAQINELQLHNATMIEEHTRDNLAIRAKEAQVVRARADTETAHQLAADKQHEIDRLKRELQRVARPTSPAPSDITEHLMNGGPGGSTYGEPNGRSASRASSNRMSFASGIEDGGGRMMSPRPQQMRQERVVSTGSDRSESGRASVAGDNNIESWKRAAEVTSQLKLRIEQMKAKQGLGRHPPSGSGQY